MFCGVLSKYLYKVLFYIIVYFMGATKVSIQHTILYCSVFCDAIPIYTKYHPALWCVLWGAVYIYKNTLLHCGHNALSCGIAKGFYMKSL